MEAAAAVATLGMVANIFQIVQFSASLCSTGRQIFQAGSTVQNAEIELVTNNIKFLSEKVKLCTRPDPASMGPLTAYNQELENLAKQSTKIADELCEVLSSIELQGNRTPLKSFRAAIKTSWSRSKLDETVQRLFAMRDELQFQLIVSMHSKVDTASLCNDQRLQPLDTSTKTIVQAIVDNAADLRSVVESQNRQISRRDNDREMAAEYRHRETLSAIRNVSHHHASNTNDPGRVLQAIKARLSFAKMDDRFEDIHLAHKRTFEWIYCNEASQDTSWTHFGDWLKKDGDVYWISGKAGSGKSTLMKLINQDKRTKEGLQAWAGDIPLLILSFYFWNPGTELQKSRRGLIQSLLFEALSKDDSLGPVLFPDLYRPEAQWEDFPTLHQLQKAFNLLTVQTVVPYRIAFLVDGLDEFGAADFSMTELAEFFTEAAKRPNVKAVLASRPLPAFEETFEPFAKLRLHELTRDDISLYVNDNLAQHKRMRQLSKDDPTGTKELVDEIVESASGVFLWVKLVVRSLHEGLQNYDILSDLKLRLRALPRDLEDLFRHMLRIIPLQYRIQSSRIFQTIHCNMTIQDSKSHRVPAIAPLSAIGLSFAEEDTKTILDSPIHPISVEERQEKQLEIEGRLRSRYAGLVELQPRSFGLNDRPSVQDVAPTVQYLHRTVADFLDKPEVWQNVIEATKGAAFDPHVALLQAEVMKIKKHASSLSFLSQTEAKMYDDAEMDYLWSCVDSAMEFARLSEDSSGNSHEELLDEMDRSMQIHFQHLPRTRRDGDETTKCVTWCDTYEEDYQRPAAWHDTFLSLTIRHGLTLYVKTKFQKHGHSIIKKTGRPLLDYACRPEPRYSLWREVVDPIIVETLLRNGADPNEKFNGFSPWQNALYKPELDVTRWLTILKLLIQYGADPNAYVEHSARRYSALYIIRQQVAKHFVSRQFSIQQKLYKDSPGKTERIEAFAAEVVALLKEKGAVARVWHQTSDMGMQSFKEEPISLDETPFIFEEDLRPIRNSRFSKKRLTTIVQSRMSRLRISSR